jgi:ankyrin repeat protein
MGRRFGFIKLICLVTCLVTIGRPVTSYRYNLIGRCSAGNINHIFSRYYVYVWCCPDLRQHYLYRRDLTRSVCRSLSWAQNNWGLEAQATATVQQAIAAGRHLDPIPEHYAYTLQGAASHGHTGLVELLLKEGIKCDLDFYLELAALGGHAAVVELLLAVPDVDPNVHIFPNYGGFNDFESFHILVYSAFKGNDAIVKLLLDHPGIDPNYASEDKGGKSALMAAEAPAVVKLLLDREDIDVNKQDSQGYTALICHIIHSS